MTARNQINEIETVPFCSKPSAIPQTGPILSTVERTLSKAGMAHAEVPVLEPPVAKVDRGNDQPDPRAQCPPDQGTATATVPKPLPILDMARLWVIRSRLIGTLATGLQLESGWSSPHRVRIGYRRPHASRPGESLSVNRPFRGPLSCVPIPTDCYPGPRFRLGTSGPKGFRPSRGKPSHDLLSVKFYRQQAAMMPHADRNHPA